jgi:hypothetical protein
MAELSRRGLAGPRGPSALLVGLLRQLADPTYEIDLRLTGGMVGLGAATATRGVVVVAAPDAPLRLQQLDPAFVPADLVDLAGEINPGRGRAVNIPADLFDEAHRAAGQGNLWALVDQLMARAIPCSDATSLAHMCTGIQQIGQLGATVRINGASRRAPWVVGFHRGDKGHFVQLRRPSGPMGAKTVTISPTTRDGLLRHLHELLSQLPNAAA